MNISLIGRIDGVIAASNIGIVPPSKELRALLTEIRQEIAEKPESVKEPTPIEDMPQAVAKVALTKRQSQILAFIQKYVADNCRAPTLNEITHAFNFRSDNASRDHVNALERRGAIRVDRGISRGIKLL